MALPQIKYPMYNTIIPSSGKNVKYRPFTVNEEKILLTAAESNDVLEMISATKNIISNCFSDIDVEGLTTYDIDYLFLQIRIKSVSPTSEMYFTNNACTQEGCVKDIKVSINLEDINVQIFDTDSEKFVKYNPPKASKFGGFTIKLTDDVGIIMKHPGFRENEIYNALPEPSTENLIKLCIVSVYDDEGQYTKDDFTEQELDEFYLSLPTSARDKLEEFITNIPKVRYETEFKCKNCGYTEPLVFEGLESFFT